MSQFQKAFPKFHRFLEFRRTQAPSDDFQDEILPPASPGEIATVEAQLGLELPVSYRRFLGVARGVTLWSGDLQMTRTHPFFHDLPSLPSQRMLCFADFCLDGEGDQVLFDVHHGLRDGEYPVLYYNHDRVEMRQLAGSFHEWLERIVAGGG